ncbi:MAG: hypothetical protein KC414_15470 [Romboutsia sp.]|nr:hypothetical protein [Romboutsia sp.]
MASLKIGAKLNQTRIKADRTATISLATLLEVNEDIFNLLNELYFNGSEVKLVIVPEEEYGEFIYNEAKKLADD